MDDPQCPNCWIGHGFKDAERSVIGEIKTEVKRLSTLYGTKKVQTTGHSMGGALANLAALDLAVAGYNVEMYTFGQPRVGNPAYAKYHKSKVPNQFRVVHYRDPVPQVPDRYMGWNWYDHSAQEIWEDKNGNLKICSAEDGEDDTCSNTVWYY